MQRTSLTSIMLLGGLFACAIGACVVLATRGFPAEALLGGVVVLVGGAVVIVAMMPGEVPRDTGAALRDKLDELADTVREMAAHNALSPDARRVLFRKQERDLLVQAIEEDIAEAQWDAAAVLVNELESRLGYTGEAAALRARIAARSTAPVGDAGGDGSSVVVTPSVQPASSVVSASRAAPLVASAVEAPEITVPVTDAARTATRQELERRFMAAAGEGRAEAAMGILAELDQYVTPEEAEPLREIARGVIAKSRDALGEQFKAAVQGKRWHEAVNVGEQIIQRFPNTRMASEVRDVMDALRARA